MPNNILQEYLVALGFHVDQPQLRRFQSALQQASLEAERYMGVGGLAGTFVKAGAVIAGTLTAIGVGLAGMADHFAQQDLDFKLFARRMFMSEEAAKKLKIATDALGYSIEEIIWGPPELADRYRRLIADQDVMIKNLGGPKFEKSMYNLRELNYQLFTRFGTGLQYLGMQLTGDLTERLFGANWLQNIDHFVSVFEKDIPAISKEIADVLVPAIKEVASWLKEGYENAKLLFEFIKSQHKAALLFGDEWGGSIIFNNPSDAQKKSWWTGKSDWRASKQSGEAQFGGYAEEIARQHHIDSSLFKALIKRESSWNPGAVNAQSGAFGFGQLMPFNMHAFGGEGRDPLGNMEISASLLEQYLKNFRGNERLALQAYGGFVSPEKVQKEFPGYFNDIQRYRKEYGGATVQPQSYNVDVGGITVNVANSNASPGDIHHAVAKGVEEALAKQNRRLLIQSQGAYA